MNRKIILLSCWSVLHRTFQFFTNSHMINVSDHIVYPLHKDLAGSQFYYCKVQLLKHNMQNKHNIKVACK